MYWSLHPERRGIPPKKTWNLNFSVTFLCCSLILKYLWVHLFLKSFKTLIIYLADKFFFAAGHEFYKSFKRQSSFVSPYLFLLFRRPSVRHVFLKVIQNSQETLVSDSLFNLVAELQLWIWGSDTYFFTWILQSS